MSRLDMHHPDHGQLLLYLDGELVGRKAKQIRTHLEACWQCRTELQALETTIAYGFDAGRITMVIAAVIWTS